MGLLGEFRKRGLFRVAGVYAVAGWFVAQAAALAENAFALPAWFDGTVIVVLLLGFPILMVASWAFELTPEGVRRAAPMETSGAAARFGGVDALIVAAIVVLIGVSALQILRAPDAPGSAVTAAPAAPADLSIAVLPFADLSPEGDQEYFSDGLSEELLNVLAQIEDLQVAGRTSSFAFKDRDEDLREIGRQLGVAHILEGSVRKDGARLRITAQLVSAADGYHLWSESYDRELSDVFAVQEEIAMAVADALSVTLGVQLAAAPGAAGNVQLYDLYLQGLAAMRTAATADDFHRAADIFRGVLAIDPGYSRARTALAETYLPTVVLFPEESEQSVREIEAIVADARDRAPDEASTHYMIGILALLQQDWAAADAAFSRAGTERGAAFAGFGQFPAYLLLYLGRAEDAIDVLREASRSDPLAPDIANVYQQALTISGRWDEAEDEYRRGVGVGVNGGPIQHMALFRVWNGGDAALIRERYDEYLRLQTVVSPLAGALREAVGDPEAALTLVRRAADDPEEQDATRQMFLAVFAAHYGDHQLAIAAMRRALLDMKGPFVQALWYPDMAPARRLPEFKDLLRDLGIVDYWRATGEWGDFCRPVGADDFECE